MSILVDDIAVDESSGLARFTVRLTQASESPVSVRWATAQATAFAGVDYGGRSGVLAFDPGQLTLHVNVPLRDDAAREGLELFKFTLSDAVHDDIGRATAWATIFDDDARAAARPVILVSDTVVDEGEDQAFFTVRLDRPGTSPVRVHVETANGNAYWGNNDYVPPPPQTLVFAPGEVVKTVAVSVPQQYWGSDPSKWFELRLSSPQGASLPDASARAFISGAAGVEGGITSPVVSVSDVLAGEGDGALRFVVSLSTRTYIETRVDFQVAGVTATAGTDFLAQSGTLVFGPNENTKIVTVPLLDDRVVEGEEVLRLTLSAPDGLTLGEGTGDVIGIIRDDDRPAGMPVIRVDDGVVDGWEPFARFNVRLDQPSDRFVTVRYATADGNAVAGSQGGDDYIDQGTQTLVFAPGEVAKTVLVPLANRALIGNGGIEDPAPYKFFVLLLSSATNATLGDPRAHMVLPAQAEGSETGEGPAQLSLRAVAAATSESGTTLDVALMLSDASYDVQPVRYTLTGGSAQAGVDFVAQPGTVLFAPGQKLQMLHIPLIDDALAEDTETFRIDLVREGDNQPVTVLARILDDERPAGAPQTLHGPADVGSLLVGTPGTTLVVGGAGDDLLDGVGAVTLRGGGGNDGYIVDAAGTRVQEGADGGRDHVYAYIDYGLGTNLEDLTLAGDAPLRGYGNALNNTLFGNRAANVLAGGEGNDWHWGWGGNDTFYGGAGDDWLYGGDGADVMQGGAGRDLLDAAGDFGHEDPSADRLEGNDGDDVLYADYGADTLDGGRGNDHLTAGYGLGSTLVLGGEGNDTLEPGAGTPTLVGGAGADLYYYGQFDLDAEPDVIRSWNSAEDLIVFQNGFYFGIGDGDLAIENATVRNAPGGFSTAAELVIFTSDIDGPITAESAAAGIGAATTSYTEDDRRLFVVDNGADSGVFLFQSSGQDARVEDSELVLITLVDGATAVSDYAFSL